MKHQGQITSEITSTASITSAPSVPVEVDPVHRDRLRVALEHRPRQLHLEVPALERNLRRRLAVAPDDADLHPVRTLGVEGCVLLAVLPEPHQRLAALE